MRLLHVCFALLLVDACSPAPVRASEQAWAFRRDVSDPGGPPRTGSDLRLALSGHWAANAWGDDYGARLMLDVPFAMVARGRKPASSSPTDDAPPSKADGGRDHRAPERPVFRAEHIERSRWRFSPDEVRAAVDAAHRDGGRTREAKTLARMTMRARRAGWIPRVRLRVARMLDESAALSPTSYDADRLIASGGARTWVGARLTWSLSRVLFAPEEVTLHRWRLAQEEKRRLSSERTVMWLSRFERNIDIMFDTGRTRSECEQARQRARGLALRIDWSTNGWLSRWLRSRRVHHAAWFEGRCDALDGFSLPPRRSK